MEHILRRMESWSTGVVKNGVMEYWSDGVVALGRNNGILEEWNGG
jgi:hypothetical protein